jgi:myo-inositol-1(or 4)-monophosphatase
MTSRIMSKYSSSVALLAFVVAGCCCWVPTGSFVHSFVLLVSPTSLLSRRPKRHSSRFHIQQEAAAANVFLVRGSSSTVHAGAKELDGETSLTHLLEVAVEAATKAGAIIKQYTDADGSSSKVEETYYKANSRDLLTIVDPLCETTIRDIVSAAFPTHRFLGEESVPPGKEASTAAIAALLADTNPPSDFLWIVDPIDGTTNFVHGMPLSAPSVAVAYKGEVVAGVIYDPHRDELFTATRGYGAYLNSQPIRVGDTRTLSEAVIAMGSPPGEESMAMSMKGVQKLMPLARTLRMIGSAAIMLAWVANGRLSCYWEYDLSSWDLSGTCPYDICVWSHSWLHVVCVWNVQGNCSLTSLDNWNTVRSRIYLYLCLYVHVAGALLVREAGGRITDLEGTEWSLTCRKICATNGAIHDEMLQALNDAGIV